MIRSTFSDAGLSIGQDTTNMTYLYGLSDFFSLMFEDTSVVNLLLESSTVTASEAYSRFLQLTSTISIETIQDTTGVQVQLVMLSSINLVSGSVSEYKLPGRFTAARYIANRPFLPTDLLEENVDYSITQKDNGDCYIRFARPISEYALSNRLLSDGTTTQYALWLVDAHLDERLMSQYFGSLINVSPENSSESLSNFVYGLYYVYTQGPTLGLMKKGLNLVLGVPLSRANETVIDIRSYLQTDQYIIITDQNQYVLPYGLVPSVAIGDSVYVGDELANWIEVKDYVNDGDWWVNLYIPSTVIPTPPPGDNSRYAIPGSDIDYLMREYLKTHSFLVNVNVTFFKNNQQFSQIIDLVRRVKPAYTLPIYTWSVPLDQNLHASDSGLEIALKGYQEYSFGNPYSQLRRNQSSGNRLYRHTSKYVRFNAPEFTPGLIGQDAYVNSSSNNLVGETIQGYANLDSLYRPNTEREADWIDVVSSRNSDSWRGIRSQISYRRGYSVADEQMLPSTTRASLSGSTVRLSDLIPVLPSIGKVVPLTVLPQTELEDKCTSLGVDAPSRWEPWFVLPTTVASQAINALYILEEIGIPRNVGYYYPTLFQRSSDLPQSIDVNTEMSREYLPDSAYFTDSDMLVGIRITCDLVGMYLISHNALVDSPSVFPVRDSMEPMTISIQSMPTRGMGVHKNPFYMSRGSVTITQASLATYSDGSSLLVDSSTQTPESKVLNESSVTDEVPVLIEALSLQDRYVQLASLSLQGLGIPVDSKIIPMTVISERELVWKCGLNGISVPDTTLTHFTLPSNKYPDFYRRDDEVPESSYIHTGLLYERTPALSEVQAGDVVLGFRTGDGAVALYLVDISGVPAVSDYWVLNSLTISRVYGTGIEAQGKYAVAPYTLSANLNYDSRASAINSLAINEGVTYTTTSFEYSDLYNMNRLSTRGGMTLTHVIQS